MYWVFRCCVYHGLCFTVSQGACFQNCLNVQEKSLIFFFGGGGSVGCKKKSIFDIIYNEVLILQWYKIMYRDLPTLNSVLISLCGIL